MVEGLAIREVLMMTIRKSLQQIIIERDTQKVSNVIPGKISLPKDVVYFVENIRKICSLFKDIITNYCQSL